MISVAVQQRRNGVQSIDRAVAILRCFDGRRPELGISELARSTGLSTTTVHRLLGAMQKNHLVRQTGTQAIRTGPIPAANGQFRCHAAHVSGSRSAVHDGSP